MSDDATVTPTGTVVGQARAVVDLAAAASSPPPTKEQSVIIGAEVGPALVVAGAGSGKTETLSMRMVYVLDHAKRLFGAAISPEQILCLTFTRKAAAEISERVERQISRVFGDDDDRSPPTVATYNAYAGVLVSEHGLRVGVDPDSAVLTDASLWQLAADIVDHWADPIDTPSAASTVTSAIPSLAAALAEHDVPPSEVERLCHEIADHLESIPSTPTKVAGKPTVKMREAIARMRGRAALVPLVEEFRRCKREGAYVDFADQIAVAGRLARLPGVQAIERARYRIVLLDEFQDTSPGQLALFRELFGVEFPVEAVGDPNQAIYGFRGASATSLDAFVAAFGGSGRVRESTLSVSWRNESGVLAAANVAAAPLGAVAALGVPRLVSRAEHLGTPELQRAWPSVSVQVAADETAEAEMLVAGLMERRNAIAAEPGRALDGSNPATAAVLCRQRTQFAPIVSALRASGVSYEVVGLGGLLDVPEVADTVALLEAAHDPGRGDSFMRLLASSRFALGASDLAALAEWSEEQAGPRPERIVDPSIVDAATDLPAEGWMSPAGRVLSAEARRRIARLAAVVADVRVHTYLSPPDLVQHAARAYALDVEVAVRDGDEQRSLDALVEAARSFAVAADRATLGGLLAWLDAAREEEAGLEAPALDPDPHAVQVLTVHQAKGLEWDVVGVAGVADGDFPKVKLATKSISADHDAGWFDGIGNLPWELRADRKALPEWRWSETSDFKEYEAALADFKVAAGAHKVSEERRLFYVALTRARAHVVLTSSWWGSRAAPRPVSRFVTELIDAGVCSVDKWAPEPGPDAEKPAPPLAAATWPRPAGELTERRGVLAGAVRDHVASATVVPADAPYAREVEALLHEREADAAAVAMPAHLSSTALVALARDRKGFGLSLRRPIPVEPSVAAERGSAFHAWIEAHFGRGSLLPDEAFGPADPDAGDWQGVGGADSLERLQNAFLTSEWADRTPTDVEVDVEWPVAGVTLRSRIDAVFPAGAGLDRVTVVDWKSSRPPQDDDERAAREIQLAVYRLAWARWKGLDVADVGAAFFYAATGETMEPAELLSESTIVALIQGEN